MTITLQTTNGATIDFPDDTNIETINSVMTQHWGPGKFEVMAPEPVTANNLGRAAATGVPILGGLLNKADAATNAFLAPALNPLFAEKDQLSEPTFGERYAHSLRDQNAADEQFAEQHPIIDAGAKLAAGAAAMVPAVAAAPAFLGASGSLASRVGMGGLSNALIGGADSAARGQGPISGALAGGALGAALPVAGAAVSPLVSGILGRINPTGYGARQAARAIAESGQSTTELANAVTTAAREGQPEFNLADALGNPGQRMLSTITRDSGEGRTAAVNDLERRQAGQGRRVQNALTEGFGTPQTAAQTEAGLTAARNDAADTAYDAVRNGAGPVDVLGAIGHIDRTLGPAADQMLANGGSAAANDSVESALQGFRARLSRVNPDDFAGVQRIRGDMADAAQNAMQSGYGNKARLIGGAVRQLDAAMENASTGFRQANADFAQASRNIEAVGQGRTAAMRGRTEDTIPRFQALTPEGQQAFRAGYVDPLIADAQGAAFGANKARPLLNDAFQAEAGAMAPGNPLMQRRLGREQTMFETRNTAMGGSKTADNLHDAESFGINPTLIGHVLSGNLTAAIGSILHGGASILTGNTPATRKAVADILLQHGPNLTPAALDALVGRTISQIQRLQRLARSGAGAAAVTTNSVQPQPRQQQRTLTRKNS